MEGWEIQQLGELATVGAGNSAPQDDALFADGTVPFFRTSDVGRIRFGDIDIAADYLNERGTRGLRRLPKGTILFPKSGASTFLNHRVMMQADGCVSSHLATITAKPEYAEPRFLLYFLSTVEAQDMVQDHAYPSLNLPLISGIKVPTPPLPEQRRIVAILDEAFEAIATAKANTEKNLQNARELFEWQHQAAFDRARERSKDYRLCDIAGFRNGINYTKQSKGQLVRIIGVRDFQNHFWAPIDDLDSVTLDGELSTADTVEEGDILSVRSNGNPELIGRCMLVGKFAGLVTHSGFTIRIRLHSLGCLPQYVCHFLKSREVRRKLVDGGNGLNIKSLNQGMLSDLVIPLPPVEIQQLLVEEIEAMKEATADLTDIATRKLAALDDLKKTFLHQAFTGELTAKKTIDLVEAAA